MPERRSRRIRPEKQDWEAVYSGELFSRCYGCELRMDRL
jgi:hypothetical protein